MFAEREEIALARARGESMRAIARRLGRCPSTISRELTRNAELMLAGFIGLQPDNEIARQMQLLANLNDPAHVERYQEFEDWFKYTLAIPGDFYLWVVEHLFRDNELIAGKLKVGGEPVDLRRIACPLNLLAGATDHITPPDQVFALTDYASTPRDEIVRDTTAGGHLGLFMGHEALTHHWPPLLEAVRAHSVLTPTRRSGPDP